MVCLWVSSFYSMPKVTKHTSSSQPWTITYFSVHLLTIYFRVGIEKLATISDNVRFWRENLQLNRPVLAVLNVLETADLSH